MALELKVEIDGNTYGDLESALEETLKLVREFYRQGFNCNETGRFHFNITGYEEEVREDG